MGSLLERDDSAVTLVEAAHLPKKGELEQLISSELALVVFSIRDVGKFLDERGYEHVLRL